MHLEDALKLDIPDEAQHTSSDTKNFFQHFGTTGCVLGCESKRTFEADLELKRSAIPIRTRNDAKAVRRSHRKDHRSRQSWFTSSELATSKSSGCGSCAVLSQVLAAVFPESVNDPSDLYSFFVDPMWELKCRKTSRPESESEPEWTVQLFQHRGKLPSTSNGARLMFDRCNHTLRANADFEFAAWPHKVYGSAEAMGR